MSRQVIDVRGEDRATFLQSLVTNDVTRADTGLVYAALLTPQGKYIADFFIYAYSDRLILDVDAAIAPALLTRLQMYRLRADVELSLSDTLVSRRASKFDGALADPRHPAMGWRGYGPTDVSDDTNWDLARVAHVIPETGIELTPETYILEAGFERLNGIDFRKGCYVGQEIAARMKHKTDLKKGLAQVTVDGFAEPGTPITAGNKPAGTLLTRSANQAIAYLRFDRASGNMLAGTAKITRNPDPI